MTDKHQSNRTKQLWEEFITSGKLDSNKLSSIVKSSWQRCYAAGVDPYDGRSHNLLGAEKLEQLLRKRADLRFFGYADR
ncbi:MAG: sigma54 specific transcriptional regulator [Firmicutes bacterium]|nr:sigma54 specific transcriptional regulator [Bacillota bacterium]